MAPDAPSSDRRLPSRALMRRGVLLGVASLGALGAAHWYNVGGSLDGSALSVTEAHAAARTDALTLIDIRRPDEWARTGVGQGAIPLDMRDNAFTQKLRALAGGTAAPIALICARGVRSRGLAATLTEAGFTTIIDVPEGMLGSGAGPGWLATGLPVVQF
jgi:rhodanese-related sulfurtransferase